MKRWMNIFFAGIGIVVSAQMLRAEDQVRIVVSPQKLRQEFQGMGCGAIFFEAHITSLGARGNNKKQKELYDAMFSEVPTRYLQLMIRSNHELKNDNDDPWKADFPATAFHACESSLEVAKAAMKRNPKIELFATLYTPPPWMKTNNAESGGGKDQATLKPNLELELAEFIWAYLSYMAKNDAPIQWLAIANEPDWAHDQPGYYLDAQAYGKLFKSISDYLDRMALTHKEVPKPKLVGPNTLSAPNAAKSYVPEILRKSSAELAAIASHDYDMRGSRWSDLQKIAKGRPVWMSEWCSRGSDTSPGQINAAIHYAEAMQDAFNGGVNVWMAYDWVYPQASAGESLIHVEWGNHYTLKKPYWLFRQWSEPLVPGMHVVESSTSGKANSAVKTAAFLAQDGKSLIVHSLNASDQEIPITLSLTGKYAAATQAERHRTSVSENDAALPNVTREKASFSDRLPAKSLTTFQIKL